MATKQVRIMWPEGLRKLVVSTAKAHGCTNIFVLYSAIYQAYPQLINTAIEAGEIFTPTKGRPTKYRAPTLDEILRRKMSQVKRPYVQMTSEQATITAVEAALEWGRQFGKCPKPEFLEYPLVDIPQLKQKLMRIQTLRKDPDLVTDVFAFSERLNVAFTHLIIDKQLPPKLRLSYFVIACLVRTLPGAAEMTPPQVLKMALTAEPIGTKLGWEVDKAPTKRRTRVATKRRT